MMTLGYQKGALDVIIELQQTLDKEGATLEDFWQRSEELRYMLLNANLKWLYRNIHVDRILVEDDNGELKEVC